ncbi:E3 ubiquitin-protein ligase RNF26 [Aythya fuligula]|uniref:E3 ubiquitin-protein ligase RNF26 n=1 Tax=Aythya fuligula TaxID=219594 RepID=A0A6J3E3D6_AYTFU|nr:E3 ubiquitin-protein ligase RNF26 [Aythya fuligula]
MALLLLLRGLRLALDVLLLLLDLNFFLVSSLLAALLWLLNTIASLPTACWHGLMWAAGGALQAVVGLLRGCWAAMEGTKALGQLVVLRGKEALRQSLAGLLGSGQAAWRQACDGVAIAGSLLAYLLNSALNVGLLGAQSLGALLPALWDAALSPALRLAELLAACLAHVSSSAVALSILLWAPCRLACETLASLAELLIGVFFVNVYGLGLLLVIIGIGAVLVNPGVLWVLVGHIRVLPACRRLQREAWRLWQLAVLALGMALTSQAWRRMVEWSLQVTDWSRGGRTRHQDSERRRDVPPPRPAAPGRLVLAVAGQEEQPDTQRVPQARPALGRSSAAGQRLQNPREEPGSSRGKAPRREQLNVAAGDGAPDDDPWVLLKEQEERKKCVICQDQTKTVLLLPCRHLCLCQECTEVLLQQAVYQRNCPLCRQMILQTLNVYL